MTEEELKALPPELPLEPPEKSASDEASEALKKQMKALEETANAERQARIAAEQRAEEERQEAARLRTAAETAGQQTVTTAIDAATSKRDMAKAEYKRAMEAGDWNAAAEAQERLSMASSELVNYQFQKNAATQGQPVTEGRVEQPQRADPVESFISSASPQSQAWLRQHRDLVQVRNGMPVLDSRVMAAHYQADADGIRPDTPDYFSFIENKLNPSKPPVIEDDEPVKPKQRNAPVSAPVSRETLNSNGQPTQRIKLTAEQVEAAHMLGDPKKTMREREIEYWNHLQALKAEGRIGNTQH